MSYYEIEYNVWFDRCFDHNESTNKAKLNEFGTQIHKVIMANRQKVDFTREGFKKRTSPLVRNKQPTGELTMSYDLNRETLDVPMPTITQTPYGAQLEYYLPLPMEASFMHGTRKVDQKFDAVFKQLKNKLKEYRLVFLFDR